MENQMCPESKRGLTVVPESVVCWHEGEGTVIGSWSQLIIRPQFLMTFATQAEDAAEE